MQRRVQCGLVSLAAGVLALLSWWNDDYSSVAANFGGAGQLPKTILILRHAEKPEDKADIHLNARGKERAKVLSQLFLAPAQKPAPFPTPDFIFAATNSDNSHRPLETVQPLAKKLKLPINADFASTEEGNKKLAEHILQNPKYSGKTLLVCWRHKTLPGLAVAFKAPGVPEKWRDTVFLTGSGKLPTLKTARRLSQTCHKSSWLAMRPSKQPWTKKVADCLREGKTCLTF